MKVKYKTKKIKYNNEKQGFGGAAPNKVESYAEGVVSEHEVQMNHAVGMDITLYKGQVSNIMSKLTLLYGRLNSSRLIRELSFFASAKVIVC